MPVLLTAAIPSMPVSFTAPVRAGSVTVTATARAETSTGSRQVAVSDAATLTVGVSARQVPLVLLDVPDLVAAESIFSVTVGAAPEVLAATTVQVTVRLAAFVQRAAAADAGCADGERTSDGAGGGR